MNVNYKKEIGAFADKVLRHDKIETTSWYGIKNDCQRIRSNIADAVGNLRDRLVEFRDDSDAAMLLNELDGILQARAQAESQATDSACAVDGEGIAVKVDALADKAHSQVRPAPDSMEKSNPEPAAADIAGSQSSATAMDIGKPQASSAEAPVPNTDRDKFHNDPLKAQPQENKGNTIMKDPPVQNAAVQAQCASTEAQPGITGKTGKKSKRRPQEAKSSVESGKAPLPAGPVMGAKSIVSRPKKPECAVKDRAADVRRLCIRSGAKNSKIFIPLESIDDYAREDGVNAYLRKLGMVKVKNVAGRKLPVLADVFKGRRCGRVLWIARQSDFKKQDREVIEATPSFCLTIEAMKDLITLYRRGCLIHADQR